MTAAELSDSDKKGFQWGALTEGMLQLTIYLIHVMSASDIRKVPYIEMSFC